MDRYNDKDHFKENVEEILKVRDKDANKQTKKVVGYVNRCQQFSPAIGEYVCRLG